MDRYPFVVLLILVTAVCSARANSFERTTGLGCIPEGNIVSYECTVTDTAGGVASTIWLGSAFDCPPSNQISLLHSQFPTASGTCGGLSAEAISVNGNDYTSQLNFTASRDLDGTTINCTLSSTISIGSDTLTIEVPPPAPSEQLSIIFESGTSLTVSWSPPSVPVVGGVGGYMFTVIGVGCGCVSTIVSADTTSVTCSGWTGNGQYCFFEVRAVSEDCDAPGDPVNQNVSLTVCDPEQLGRNPTSDIDPGSVIVDNGVVVYTGVTPQSTASLTCNNGFRPGADFFIRTCMTDGIWSGNLQSCETEPPQNLGWIAAVVLAVVLSIIAVIAIITLGVYFGCRARKHKSEALANDVDGGERTGGTPGNAAITIKESRFRSDTVDSEIGEENTGPKPTPERMSHPIDPVVHGKVAYFRPYQCRVIYKCELEDTTCLNASATWISLGKCLVRDTSLALIPQKGIYDLYTVGGEKVSGNKTSTNKIYFFNKSTNQWDDACNRFPSMIEARKQGTVVLHGTSHLIVAGGRGVDGPTKTVEILNLSTKKWKKVSELPRTMFRASGCISDGYLYLLGGYDIVETTLKHVNIGYRALIDKLIASSDTDKTVFEKIADPRLPTSAFVCVSDRVFAIGGTKPESKDLESSKAIYEYNPVEDVWKKREDKPLVQPRSFPFAVAFHAGPKPTVMVVGGKTPRQDDSATDSVEYIELP